MKRFLLLAAFVGGFILAGSSSTARADGWGGGWGGGYGNCNGNGYGGWARTYPVYNGYASNGYFTGNSGYFGNRGYAAYGYNGAYVGPVFNGGGPRFGVGINT